MSTGEEWEKYAAWWRDGFSEGADIEYREQILPLARELMAGCRRVLDVGTGEGQAARMLLAEGADLVMGMDLAFNQIREAAARGVGSLWVQANAQDLPVRPASFDGALACLMLDHVPDLDRAFGELATALEEGGRLVILTNHPLLQTRGSGWIDDQVLDPPEQYWRVGPYLEEGMEVDEVEKDVFITFYHRTLSTILNCAIDNGLRLQKMLEPAPPEGFLASAPEYKEAGKIPRLLAMVFERSPT